MSPELIGIISAGVSLAALFIGLFAWLRQDMKERGREIKELRKELAEQGQELRNMITEQGQELRKELAEQGQELRNMISEQGQELRKELAEQGKEIEAVKIEVASLKATVETYFRVRVDPPPTAAVAEAPEDYGAD